MLEDRAGNLWVGVDDGLYLFKDGRFRRLPEPNHQPLGMVVGMTEDIDGNIWAECAGKPRKLVRIRDFQVREEFPASQVPPGHNLAPDPHGGIWIGTRKGDLVLFRERHFGESFRSSQKASPVNRQIIAQPDGSVLAGSEDGLVGLRQGKVQRMTTKNGLPCDFVISFIQDKEKRWWLYTRCGVVEFSDSELQRWWANPDAIVQNRVYDTFDGAQPNIGLLSMQPRTLPMGACGLPAELSCRWWIRPGSRRKRYRRETYIESVIVDRKEFPATANLKSSRRIPVTCRLITLRPPF